MTHLVDWFDTLGRRQKGLVFLLLLPLWLLSARMRAKVKNLFVYLGNRVSEWWTDIIDRRYPEYRLAVLRWWNRVKGTPVPDDKLMTLVAGSDDIDWFLRSGKLAASSIKAVLKKNGIKLRKDRQVLDFGCGVGRVIKYFKAFNGPTLFGTDYNHELIDWCRGNLKFASFGTNELTGKLNYADEKFDFVYALSVFTHLIEKQQDFWIEELYRVLKPGGHLLITVHGSDYYLKDDILPADHDRFKAGELICYGDELEGTNICTAFHPETYVRQTMAGHFLVADHVPEGALGNPKQDIFLLEKPMRSPVSIPVHRDRAQEVVRD